MATRLGRVNQANAEPIALAVASALFSTLAVAVAPVLESAGSGGKVAGAAVGTLSLTVVFLVLRRALHTAWSRSLLGVWVYRTVPHDEGRRSDTGYGVAELGQARDGALTYRVDLYRGAMDALLAAEGNAPEGESHGTAASLALEFDDASGALWILYQVQYYSDVDPDREGHLFVRAAGPAGHRVLRGSWASDLMGRELSAGVMTMMRPADFRLYVESDTGRGR